MTGGIIYTDVSIDGSKISVPVGSIWFNEDGSVNAINILPVHEINQTLTKMASDEQPVTQRIETYVEPTTHQIEEILKDFNGDYWHARNHLRERMNGRPPHGFTTWGDYWKTA